MTEHYIDDAIVHPFWDNAYPPRLVINPGDIVIFECRDSSDGQIKKESTAEVLDTTDFSRIHPLTGPIFVEGAKKGDTLEIEILELKHKGWGWNAIRPNFGLLTEDFSEPYLHHWVLNRKICRFKAGSNIHVPFEPFCGVMGVAPKEPGRIDTTYPRDNCGNVDIKGLVTGATVWIPTHVPGALFSIGDCHAAQGDGEVCGNGIEAPMTVTLRINLRKNLPLPGLQFRTPSPLSKADNMGYYATTAFGPDLYVNAQNAIRYMIDYLVRDHQLEPEEAYVLCSVATDLRISEIVDAPNWVVSAYTPLSIFEEPNLFI
jgi:acetamidase/formamidase